MVERRPLTVGHSEPLTNGTDRDLRQFLHAFMGFSRRREAIRGHLYEARYYQESRPE